MPETRKLTTVLFADIAGYTALMQKDEKRAIHLLNRFKTILENTIALHNGEIIQYFGDGCLLTFDSGVQGTKCAVTMQLAFREADVPVRIGMHVGDVIFRNNNIFGDGVNVASRVESLGIPGVVLLSKTVRNQIKNKPEFELVSLGEFDFKNVVEPVEVFAIANEGMVIPRRSEMKGKVKEKPTRVIQGKNIAIYLSIALVLIEAVNFVIERYNWEPLLLDILIIFLVFGVLSTLTYSFFKGRWNKTAMMLHAGIALLAIVSTGYFVTHPLAVNPRSLRLFSLSTNKSPLKNLNSIAVLPIQNNLSNGEKDYLLAGLQDGIITELGKLGSIKTISRTSTLAFLQSPKSLKQIGAELQVNSLLESSLSPSREGYVYRVRLLDSHSEQLLWSNEFSTSFRELPILIDEVSKIIALKLNPETVENVKVHEDINPAAYEEILKGNYLLQKFSKDEIFESITHYQKAIELDSTNIEGYLGIARSWIYLQQISVVDPKIARPQILKHGEIAVRMDPDHWQTYNYLGTKAFYIDYDYDTGIELLEKSIALNPNDSGTRSLIAHFYMLVNDWDKAWEQIRYAREIDPLNPQVIGFESMMNFRDNKFLSGIKLIETLGLIDKENIFVKHANLLKSRAFGNMDEAIADLKDVYEDHTNDPIALNQFIDQEYAEHQDFDRMWLAVLRYFKEIDYLQYYPAKTAGALQGANLAESNDELFFECLAQMAADRDPNMPYYAIKDGQPIQDDHRYINIMTDLGLW